MAVETICLVSFGYWCELFQHTSTILTTKVVDLSSTGHLITNLASSYHVVLRTISRRDGGGTGWVRQTVDPPSDKPRSTVCFRRVMNLDGCQWTDHTMAEPRWRDNWISQREFIQAIVATDRRHGRSIREMNRSQKILNCLRFQTRPDCWTNNCLRHWQYLCLKCLKLVTIQYLLAATVATWAPPPPLCWSAYVLFLKWKIKRKKTFLSLSETSAQQILIVIGFRQVFLPD